MVDLPKKKAKLGVRPQTVPSNARTTASRVRSSFCKSSPVGVSSKKRDTSAVRLLSISKGSPHRLGICGNDPPKDPAFDKLAIRSRMIHS